MARYIDADAILKEIYHRANLSSLGEITTPHLDWKEVVSIIKEAPTADVVEVKHGHWIGQYPKVPKCSVCSAVDSMKGNYCRYCGAKMDGERKL